MKKYPLKNIFAWIVAFTTICGFLTYVFKNVAERQNPEFVGTLFSQLGKKLEDSIEHDEVKEEDLHDVRRLKVISLHGDLEIQPYEGDTLRVQYFGKVPKGETQDLIEIASHGDEMAIKLHSPPSHQNFSIQWNNSQKSLVVSDVGLTAKVFLPRKFAGALRVQSTSGDIDIKNLELRELYITSISGDVELEKLKVEGIKIEVTHGDINSEGSFAKLFDIQSISGDTYLALPPHPAEKEKTPQAYQFDLASTSGDIENTSALEADRKSKNAVLVKVRTTSGDIHISRYAEEFEDRD